MKFWVTEEEQAVMEEKMNPLPTQPYGDYLRKMAIDKGTNPERHLIQASEPEEFTPEKAHEIGPQLAKEILGDRYEFVLATHIDKDHVHNHLIFNAVSIADHRYYHSNKRS